MKKHLAQAPAPRRRLTTWKRNLVAGVAVATLAPAGIIAGAGIANAGTTSSYADPTVKSGQACPADATELAQRAVDAYNADPAGFNAADIANDDHSVYKIARNIGAPAYYNAGNFGFDKKANKPVDIALIDTGVAPVKGLDNGNVVQGPDLSFDSQNPNLAHLDGYGHGTHLASIMVGRDIADGSTARQDGAYGWKDPKSFTGIAPGARVVSVKTGDASGANDPTQVIAGIDWVVKHAKDPGFNIRVITLAYGLNSPLFDTFKNDPLSYAIEQAWNAGIVVVAATGNDGQAKNRPAAAANRKMGVAGPSFNPTVIAAGAYDSHVLPGPATPPDFTQGASEANRRAPDFSAPGVSILGLHASGSVADDEIIGDCQSATDTWTQPVVGPDARFVRGSGTSQAAAVVSAAVALILSRPMSDTPTPTAAQSPDWVKAVLKNSAANTNGISTATEGQGRICLNCAMFTAPKAVTQSVGNAAGGGSIDAMRGAITDDDYLWDGSMTGPKELVPGACTPGNYYFINFPGFCQGPQKNLLKGNVDIFGNAVDPVVLASKEAVNAKTGAYVNGGAWTTNADGTESWFNGSFTLNRGLQADPNVGPAWTSADWSASPKTDHLWSGYRWSGYRWSGYRWSGYRWHGYRWSGYRWSGYRWSTAAFKAASWS